ncbi:MAG: ribonuclease P protein component [Deltaproteobacteria bacterium]|nr:ribonuclease P protein component [Deltaproteobacteria bacterium]MBI3754699.1 ribonuclease P protein component [Deltaproteobacteria bacterium]
MGQYSFSRAERILRSKDFTLVRKEGERVASKNLVIFLKTNKLGIKRFGLGVSTKIGEAVKRNRIKRLLREFFRLNKEVFPLSTDVFISVKQGFNPAGYKEVEAEIKSVILGCNFGREVKP